MQAHSISLEPSTGKEQTLPKPAWMSDDNYGKRKSGQSRRRAPKDTSSGRRTSHNYNEQNQQRIEPQQQQQQTQHTIHGGYAAGSTGNNQILEKSITPSETQTMVQANTAKDSAEAHISSGTAVEAPLPKGAPDEKTVRETTKEVVKNKKRKKTESSTNSNKSSGSDTEDDSESEVESKGGGGLKLIKKVKNSSIFSNGKQLVIVTALTVGGSYLVYKMYHHLPSMGSMPDREWVQAVFDRIPPMQSSQTTTNIQEYAPSRFQTITSGGKGRSTSIPKPAISSSSTVPKQQQQTHFSPYSPIHSSVSLLEEGGSRVFK